MVVARVVDEGELRQRQVGRRAESHQGIGIARIQGTVEGVEVYRHGAGRSDQGFGDGDFIVVCSGGIVGELEFEVRGGGAAHPADMMPCRIKLRGS